LSGLNSDNGSVDPELGQDERKWPILSSGQRFDAEHGARKNHPRGAGQLLPSRTQDARRPALIRKLGHSKARKTHEGQCKQSSEYSHVIPFLKETGPGVVLGV
jgi:hypothetical protein